MALTKIETLTVDKGKLTLATVIAEDVEVTTEEMIARDKVLADDILRAENDVRVAQARVDALKARKPETAALAAEALAKAPLPVKAAKPVEPDEK